MRTRSTVVLSSFHLIAALEGLLRTTEELKLDAEEKRRLEAAREACEPLREEVKKRAISTETEANVRAWDEVVDRNWGVLYGVLAKLAVLADVLPIGTEAAALCRTTFATKLDFIRKDAAYQAQVGSAKLGELESTKLSAALGGVLRPVLAIQREAHTGYEAAIAEKADTVKVKSELQTARKAAIEAIDAFIGYVEVMATTPKSAARATAVLAPVDALLAAAKRASRPKGERAEDGGDEEDEEDVTAA